MYVCCCGHLQGAFLLFGKISSFWGWGFSSVVEHLQSYIDLEVEMVCLKERKAIFYYLAFQRWTS